MKLRITYEAMEEIMFGDQAGTGFCRTCGNEQLGCEPDAENYECEGCGAMEVFGAEQLMIMGELEVE